MTRMAALGQFMQRSPLVAGVGQGALAAGLSAYGNLADENDRSKGDQRMILEAALAALGGGLAAGGARQFMNQHSVPMTRRLQQMAQRADPVKYAGLQSAYQASPLAGRIPPAALMNLAATSLAAGAGAGIGGVNVAPAVADQMGLMQAPGSWTRRANDWNWDRQTEAEQRIAEEILSRLQQQEVAA